MTRVIYYWSSETRIESGEGQLSNLFLKILKENIKNTKLINLNTFKYKNNFTYKYLLPFYGIIKIWIKYFRGYRTIYVNYLPFWNFLIFLLLPVKCLLGPITGTYYVNNSSKIYQKIFRKYFLPILFHLSLKTLNFKKKEVLFSNNNFNHLRNKIKSCSNFQLLYLKKNTQNLIKDIDIFIYLKDHANKNSELIVNIIDKLKYSNHKIIIVGKKILNKKILSYKILPNSKIQYLMKRTKLVILSSEILFSFMCMDALNNNSKIVFFRNFKNEEKFLEKNSYFKVLLNSDKKIVKYINNLIYSKKYLNKVSKSIILIKEKKRIQKFVKNYLKKIEN